MFNRWLESLYNGHVRVEIIGGRVQEFLNRAAQEGLMIWDIQRNKQGQLFFYINRSDIRKMIPIVKQTKSRIRFGTRTGLPFMWTRIWQRKMFILGALGFIVGLNVVTSFVWEVDVEGLDKLSKESVLQAAEQIGIKQGAYIRALPDNDILQAQLLDKVPGVTWAGVRVHGTHVTIQVVEKVPRIEPKATTPQDIVAKKRGTVQMVYANRGLKVVKVGQLVNPGDVLITGVLGDGQTTVAAKGVVEAQVWYTSDVEVPLVTYRQSLTGESITRDYLLVGPWSIPVWGFYQSSWPDVHVQRELYQWSLAGIKVPFQFAKDQIYEVKKDPVSLTEQESVTHGLELAAEDAVSKTEGKGKVTSQKILQTKFEHGKLYLKVLNVVLEDIGEPRPINK